MKYYEIISLNVLNGGEMNMQKLTEEDVKFRYIDAAILNAIFKIINNTSSIFIIKRFFV